MSDTEKLHFKIGIAGTYWKKVPVYSILINDSVVVDHKAVTGASEETYYEEFDYTLEEGPAVLKILLENKDNGDTIVGDDGNTILKDMLLNIKSIEIDEIDIGSLIYSNSKFVGNEDTRPVLDGCVDLGWNGTWTFPFESPFYIWLLENL